MTEYFKDIEQARNITEIKEILYLVRKKYFTSLTSVFALLDAYQGKYRQVGHRFKQLKENVLKELRGIFTLNRGLQKLIFGDHLHKNKSNLLKK